MRQKTAVATGIATQTALEKTQQDGDGYSSRALNSINNSSER